MNQEISDKILNHSIDELEAVMLDNFPVIDCPVTHRFTDGMYVREIFMPAGAFITSKIHKTQHQFFILKGKATVWIDGVEETIEAPYIGITEPGTRRVLLVLEDCIWATSHPNPNNETLEQLEERIIEKNDNPYLTEDMKKKIYKLQNTIYKCRG
jgi:quercetin dioxygenase-like cupin family protein